MLPPREPIPAQQGQVVESGRDECPRGCRARQMPAWKSCHCAGTEGQDSWAKGHRRYDCPSCGLTYSPGCVLEERFVPVIP